MSPSLDYALGRWVVAQAQALQSPGLLGELCLCLGDGLLGGGQILIQRGEPLRSSPLSCLAPSGMAASLALMPASSL